MSELHRSARQAPILKGKDVSSSIEFENQRLWLSNLAFDRIWEFVIDVAEQTARDTEEREFVAKLKTQVQTFWPGVSIDVGESFPDIAEKKFLARCFADLARWIFLRRIGNQTLDCWQSGVIYEAHTIARLFIESVRKEEPRFYPESEDDTLIRKFYEEKAAEPGATDNPDGAQRLREDY